MFTLFLFILCLLLVLAGLELAIRLRSRSDKGEWRIRPLPTPDPQAIRIVVLGDSIAYGPDLVADQTWPALLSEGLSTAYPLQTWQVINAGVCGNTVADGYARFDSHVRAYQPHMVLIAFGLNDCRQIYRAIDRRRIAQFERNETHWWGKSYVVRALANRLAPLPQVDYSADVIAETARIPPETFQMILTWLVQETQRIKAQPVLLTPTPVSSDLSSERQAEFEDRANYATLIRDTARKLDVPFIELSHRFSAGQPWAADGVHLSATGERFVFNRVWQALHRPQFATILGVTPQVSNAEMAPSLD